MAKRMSGRPNEIEQQSNQLDRLTRSVAHDLNNVLTAILGCADLLAIRLEGNDVALEEAHEIQRAAERAAALVKQLLASRTPSRTPPPTAPRARDGSEGPRKKASPRR